MTSRVQNARSSVTTQRPPNTRPIGEFYVNFADNQMGVIDPTPTARDLLPIRFHSAAASYAINAVVQQGAGLYQAKAAIPPRAFTSADWNQFLTNAQGDARWLSLSGGTLTGPLTLSGPPTVALHAATKAYVDTTAGNYLPLAGGVLTGALTLPGPPTIALHAATKAYVDATAGNYLLLTGGTVSGQIVAQSFVVSASGGYLAANANYSYYAQDASGWNLRYRRSDGQLEYVNSANTSLFVISPGGNGHFAGSIFTIWDSYCGIQADATSAHCTFANTWSFDWNRANGDLAWSGGGATRFYWRVSDSLAYNPIGPVGGNGAYVNISDERTKTDIGPSPYGLSHILQIEPILFHRLKPDGTPSDRVEIGFGAQQVQPVIPEAVVTAGFPNPDTLAISIDGIVAALVGAVQQLDQRVSQLEAPAA